MAPFARRGQPLGLGVRLPLCHNIQIATLGVVMKLVHFEVIQLEDIGYLRQVQCSFAMQPVRPVEPHHDVLNFRLAIPFEEQEHTLERCLLEGLHAARAAIEQEIVSRFGPQALRNQPAAS